MENNESPLIINVLKIESIDTEYVMRKKPTLNIKVWIDTHQFERIFAQMVDEVGVEQLQKWINQ